MMIRLIQNRKGQVAIFIALLFQVLFLFFAMIVNVGLLIHHKINLQNSVDLAAYYGAMKQAEVLNAIGHVNYQIRQSWKLLNWRQRVLGSAGAGDPNAPYPRLQANPGALADILAGGNPLAASSSPYRLPRFCISYEPHELQNGQTVSENSCREMHQATAVNLPNPGVLIIPGFFGFGSLVSTAITNAVNTITERCDYVGTANFIYGGRFIIAHNYDAEQRAYLINYLATGLSSDQDNFYELEGGSARDGIEKTLSKNLTDANRASMNFRVLNGMAQGACRSSGSQVGSAQLQNNAPAWLVPVEVYPVWRYYDCAVTGGTITQSARQLAAGLTNRPQRFASSPATLQNEYNQMEPFLGPRPVLTGYEKDPWCMAYVGVKAETRPKIPFMPLTDISLTAEAYAKPFGGRIGPWYVNRWQPGEFGNNRITSTGNNPSVNGKTELANQANNQYAGSVRVLDVGAIADPNDPSWAANISRFPGDTLGWASERVLAFFHKVIRQNAFGNPASAYMRLYDGQTLPFPMASDERPSLRHYASIGSQASVQTTKDQLTWDDQSNGAPKLRLAEIAAVAPDLFDMSYYSIDPDFYNNYYAKIELHRNRRGGFATDKQLLSDVGSRFGGSQESQRFNVFDQIKIQRMVGNPDALNSQVAMPYVNKNAAHLLNSWSVDSIIDFTNNATRFGSCIVPATGAPGSSTFDTPLLPATPGNCIYGGRVGYSVKLVARDHLQDTALELGGPGVSGAIRNPPPDGW